MAQQYMVIAVISFLANLCNDVYDQMFVLKSHICHCNVNFHCFPDLNKIYFRELHCTKVSVNKMTFAFLCLNFYTSSVIN